MAKFEQYKSFITVVESGSVTAAANQLNLTVSAVSKQLTQLEQSLKVTLFLRSHKRLDLTEHGREFYSHCKHIVSEVKIGETRLTDNQSKISGELALTLSKS